MHFSAEYLQYEIILGVKQPILLGSLKNIKRANFRQCLKLLGNVQLVSLRHLCELSDLDNCGKKTISTI